MVGKVEFEGGMLMFYFWRELRCIVDVLGGLSWWKVDNARMNGNTLFEMAFV